MSDTVKTVKKDRDELGLLFVSPEYAKHNCKRCYGRGMLTVLVSTGKERTIVGDNFKRTSRPCLCVHRGYIKRRAAVEAENEERRQFYEETLLGEEDGA